LRVKRFTTLADIGRDILDGGNPDKK